MLHQVQFQKTVEFSILKYFCQDKAGIAQEKRIDIF